MKMSSESRPTARDGVRGLSESSWMVEYLVDDLDALGAAGVARPLEGAHGAARVAQAGRGAGQQQQPRAANATLQRRLHQRRHAHLVAAVDGHVRAHGQQAHHVRMTLQPKKNRHHLRLFTDLPLVLTHLLGPPGARRCCPHCRTC